MEGRKKGKEGAVTKYLPLHFMSLISSETHKERKTKGESDVMQELQIIFLDS